MSTYKHIAMRLIFLTVLVLGVLALSKPQVANALTCTQQCIQNERACLAACNNPPGGGQDPSCIPDCFDDYQACLAGC